MKTLFSFLVSIGFILINSAQSQKLFTTTNIQHAYKNGTRTAHRKTRKELLGESRRLQYPGKF